MKLFYGNCWLKGQLQSILPMLLESQVEFCCPQNIYGSSQIFHFQKYF